MRRKQPKRRAGNMVPSIMAGIFIFAILVGGVCVGASSADANDEAARMGLLDFGVAHVDADAASVAPSEPAGEMVYREPSLLASPSIRTITAGMQMLDERDRRAAERIARLDATVLDRVAAQKAMQGVYTSSADKAGASEYDLPAVDWSVGRAAFVKEWGERIDAYLAKSHLEGYGPVFAEAAWINGVDPRWSPAISNTESGKGSACIRAHNAWGWGAADSNPAALAAEWPSWEAAINAHVAGLAAIYGYSLTYEAAGTYCPPNQDRWYHATLAEMASI